MQSILKRNGKKVLFHYDIADAEKASYFHPGYPTHIIDLWWNEPIYSRDFNKAIYDDMESIEVDLLADAERQKADAFYDHITKDLP